mmetsp:Transcript_8416/g.34186  ORF Transcript_8416/g.34186 Transcript_8416/m.34186 type:complete len:203 (-) Transcript_8416:600-1208(-)
MHATLPGDSSTSLQPRLYFSSSTAAHAWLHSQPGSPSTLPPQSKCAWRPAAEPSPPTTRTPPTLPSAYQRWKTSRSLTPRMAACSHTRSTVVPACPLHERTNAPVRGSARTRSRTAVRTRTASSSRAAASAPSQSKARPTHSTWARFAACHVSCAHANTKRGVRTCSRATSLRKQRKSSCGCAAAQPLPSPTRTCCICATWA